LKYSESEGKVGQTESVANEWASEWAAKPTADLLWEKANAGRYWSMGQSAANLELHLQNQHLVPRTLPMMWGPPPFISQSNGKVALEVVSLLADVLQSASLRAKNAVEKGQNQGTHML
jgi:hypothetical protein